MHTHTPISRHRRLALIAASALLLGAAACGDDDDTATDTTGGGAADTATVSVEDNVFVPDSVDISTGGTVTWEWDGEEPHNVVGDDFESDLQTEGTFEHTFDDAGTYDYICTVHPGMEGTVNVSD